MQINGEKPKWGHRADEKKPYKAVGNFVNIIPVIEEIKQNLPNLKALHHESNKYIAAQKRADRYSIYKEGSVDPIRTKIFMEEGFKELKCEPKKLGASKRTQTQRFDLQQKHIDLNQALANDANFRGLMTELEKQFMEDPEF